MQLKIYNSLTAEKEIFTPINGNKVGMYVCGPTVYSNVHLGNVRTFLNFDFIYRSLKHLGFEVRYVRNITDAGHLTDDGDVNNDRFVKQSVDFICNLDKDCFVIRSSLLAKTIKTLFILIFNS